MYIGVHI